MSDRPDDITEEIWEAAQEAADLVFDASLDLYETGISGTDPQLVIARVIMQAESRGYARGMKDMAWSVTESLRNSAIIKEVVA